MAKKTSGSNLFTRRHSQRFLMAHQESEDVFEVYGERAFNHFISDGLVENVTGIPVWEQRYKMKKPEEKKKCKKHQVVFLSTREKPHIAACLECKAYKPNPHPSLSEEEVLALIEFVKVVSEKNFSAKNESISEKVAHVKAAKQTRKHECHWPGCKEQVKPALWGCKNHWFRLPERLRNRIWATYSSGQEETGKVSPAYVHVAREVQEWIESQELL